MTTPRIALVTAVAFSLLLILVVWLGADSNDVAVFAVAGSVATSLVVLVVGDQAARQASMHELARLEAQLRHERDENALRRKSDYRNKIAGDLRDWMRHRRAIADAYQLAIRSHMPGGILEVPAVHQESFNELARARSHDALMEAIRVHGGVETGSEASILLSIPDTELISIVRNNGDLQIKLKEMHDGVWRGGGLLPERTPTPIEFNEICDRIRQNEREFATALEHFAIN